MHLAWRKPAAYPQQHWFCPASKEQMLAPAKQWDRRAYQPQIHIAPGDWNTPGNRKIHASDRSATALLEKLAHGSGRLRPNRHYARSRLPLVCRTRFFVLTAPLPATHRHHSRRHAALRELAELRDAGASLQAICRPQVSARQHSVQHRLHNGLTSRLPRSHVNFAKT
jgi:hypothetical protein